MFNFTASEATLTPLPPRLSLRSSTPSPAPPTAAYIFEEPPHSPPARPASAASHSPARVSLAEDALAGWGSLLSQDPRLSAGVYEVTDEGSHASMMALPGAGIAITGRDAPLLLHEMERAHRSAGQHRLRRIALWAGLLTLVVLGLTGWFVFETVWALVSAGARGRGVVRWVELGVGLFALHGSAFVVPWLRTRRTSRLSLPTFTLAVLTFGLHLSLAASNLVLAIVWRNELGRRCTWGFDVAWTMGRSGKVCWGDESKGWIVAAAVRLIVTALVGSPWLGSLRAFHRCLRISFIVDPTLAPSAEARDIFIRHTANIVPLSSQSHLHGPPRDPNHLPPMPDRSAHYAWVSETNSWVPSEQETGKGAGVVTWLGAKVMGAVGWLMGVEPFEKARSRSAEGDVEKGEKQAMLLREGRGSDSIPGQRWSVTSDMRIFAPLDLDNPRPLTERRSSAASSALDDAQRYRGLFSNITRPSQARSNSQPTTPLLRPQSFATERSVASGFDLDDDDAHLRHHEQLHEQYLTQADDHNEPEKPLPPTSQSRTGSSGSTGGSLVYVRMSDGRLVRKLSTIASEVSEATMNGHPTATSGSGGRQSRGQASTSWETALDSEEVLEEAAEIREVESSAGGWRRSIGR